MKTKFFWAYIIVLVFSSFVNASPDKDDMKYTDEKVTELRNYLVKYHNMLVENVNGKKVQIEELQKSVKELQARVDRVDGLREKGAANLETVGRKGDITDIKANVALWITIPIVMVICGILCFAFWPRKSKSVAISSARPDPHKCPRCGTEHAPGETVCKHCQTQF